MKKRLLFLTIFAYIGLSATAQNPLLWGMTAAGGADTLGTIFKINGDGSGFQTLQSLNTITGDAPDGTLIYASNHKFYGVALTGGANNKGTIFSLDTNNVFTNVHDFTGNAGSYPKGRLLQANNGKLYGMTFYDDSIGAGVIFKYNPVNNTFAKLVTFNGTGNGQSPRGSLMQATDGKIYGMCQAGGANQFGTLFRFDTLTNTATNLHSFSTATGFNPFGNLIQASNGLLYGLCMYFGTTGPGTIFSFNPSSNVFTDLIHFSTTNGGFPEGSLLQASDGKLYGLTYGGGSSSKGVLFCYDINANTITDLVVFTGTNGSQPSGSLIQASDHNLYGTTTAGGANNKGEIFKYNILTSTFTDIHDFNGTDGKSPGGSLIEALKPISTGMKNFSSQDDKIRISPNPATNLLTISLPGENPGICTMNLYDIVGEKVLPQLSFSNAEFSINIDKLSPGIYFLEVNNHGTKKLIKVLKINGN